MSPKKSPWYERLRVPGSTFRSWVLPGLALILVTASTWFGVQAGAAETQAGETTTRGLQLATAVGAGIITIGVKVAGDIAEHRRRQADLSSRAQTQIAFNDALDPLAEALAELMCASDEAGREKAYGSLLSQALNSIVQVIDVPRTRASYYEHMPTARTGPRAGKARLKRVGGSAGRSGRARSEFIEGTEAGDYVLKQLVEDEIDFCEDVKKKPRPGMNPKNCKYRTFISVPSRANDVAYGLVTIDAPRKNTLRRADGDFVRVVATILAVGRQIRDTK